MKTPQSKSALLATPLAIFGFLLIIATGTSMMLNGDIPLFTSFIGLFFIIIATLLRKRDREKQ
ncbi:MAG: hypothetical protein QCI00_02970 [Candidatus Thermoplasmatota archaeon]|nr:hypothetical protein [Candidatus Thermoplasmatota archaeon]